MPICLHKIGYDEGGFSAAVGLASFKNDFDLNSAQWKNNATGLANRTANITSFGVLGAAFGAVLALCLTDRMGRLRCWQFFIALWASGIFMQVFSSGIYGFMLFARIWGGLGSGGLTVVAPLYLSEIAPARSRGTIVSIYMVQLLTWLSVGEWKASCYVYVLLNIAGFFINYGASQTMAATREQYRLVMAVPLMPVGLAFIGSFFLQDTPRWLASKNRAEESIAVLGRLRHTDTLETEKEFEQIRYEIEVRKADLRGVSTWTICKEIWQNMSYRKRFLLGITMQTVAQWTGGNGYAVNVLLDNVMLTIYSITYYIPQIFTYAGVTGSNQSLITSGAYGCVKLFFTLVFTWGMVDVLGRRISFMTGLSLQLAAHVWMAIYTALYLDGSNQSASDAAITAVFVYAVGWSIGLCTVQYLYGTEIFPTRIRSVCYGANMTLHWLFQFAVVRVTPNMLVSLDVYGAFVFWACICAIGLVVLGLWAPETKNIPMEKMDELFAGKWYTLWKSKVDLTTDEESSSEGSVRKESAAPDVKGAMGGLGE